MTAFINLPAEVQTALTVLMFIAFVGEICLLFYIISHKSTAGKIAVSALFLLILITLLILLAQGDPESVIQSPALNIPWAVLAAAVMIAAVHLFGEFRAERRRAGDFLTPAAIREAINDLPMGLCFFDPENRIVLCNDKMRRLLFEIMGAFPQSAGEVNSALEFPEGSAVRLNGELFRMEDGNVYQFRETALTVSGETGWRQLSAQDVTGLYILNRQINAENDKLRSTNSELKKMYARMTEDIREKESLEIKMYVHDTMGRSLITIQDIMNTDGQTEKKLAALQSAVSVLSEILPSSSNTLGEVVKTAEKLGVKVNISGDIPEKMTSESLITAAIRECVTNCLRHADGDEVYVEINREKANLAVIITNNGNPPNGEITEGSGLSSLRHSVEASGGEMTVSASPRFRLEIRLAGKENL